MVRDEYPDQEGSEAEKNMLNIQEENNRENTGENHRNEEMEWSDEITEHLEGDTYTVGFKMLENELDRLNSFLDDLEQKNDNIHAELIELLRSNREVRQQFQGSLQIEEQQSDQQS